MDNIEKPESEKFDATVRKILSVSHDELKRREKIWKRNKTRRNRAKVLREARASSDKD